MLNLLAFVVVAVGLATPFVVPLIWGTVRNGFSFLKSPVNNEENMSYNMLSNISVVLVWVLVRL